MSSEQQKIIKEFPKLTWHKNSISDHYFAYLTSNNYWATGPFFIVRYDGTLEYSPGTPENSEIIDLKKAKSIVNLLNFK